MVANVASLMLTMSVAVVLATYAARCYRIGAITFTPKPITRRESATSFWIMLGVLGLAAVAFFLKSLQPFA